MLAPQLVAAPDPLYPAVSLEELKQHLRVDTNEDDILIDSLGRAAEKHLDGWTGTLGGVCLVEQTWSHSFESFPCGEPYRCSRSGVMKNVLRFRLEPVIEIVSVKYYDTAGVLQTVSSSNYRILSDALGSYLAGAPGIAAPWPASLQCREDAVIVEAKFGYGESEDVPEDLRGAICNRVKKSYSIVRQRDLSLTREVVDGVGSQEWRGNGDAIKQLDDEFDKLIARYKRTFFA